MRAGITCRIEHSMYSSGTTNTALAVAELCRGLGYAPTLINTHGNNEWWDDCLALKKIFPVVNLEDVKEMTFNIMFEIGLHTVKSEERARIAQNSVWIVRKPFVLQEIESSIFPIMRSPRDTEGIREAWLLEDVTDPNDRTVLETLCRVPVRQVPYLWTPLISEVYIRSTGSGPWKGNPTTPVSIRIADTNVSSSSSSTIPLVILYELERRKFPVGDWKLNNGEGIVKSKFFRENILKHCTSSDMSGCCVGRQRCVNWLNDENCVALVHLRFHSLRPILLDLAWAGIPVIHNSPAFLKIGNGADRFYYHANSISGGAGAFDNLMTDLKDETGWFSKTNLRREEVLRRWSPVSGYVKSVWSQSISNIVQNVVPIETPIHSQDFKRIVFTDMWDSFVPEYNFFTLLLNESGKTMSPPRIVKGYADHETPDLVIFGPFGDRWKTYGPEVPKVYFTGENRRPVEANLSLGFDYLSSENYLRFPLWITYINWFCADVDRLQNPKPIPLELCTRNCFLEKKKFCAFVVTNPTNPVRNEAFKWISEYKPVDSAGNLYNNMGYAISSPYPGGGGGEHVKVNFLKDYQFCITYENSSYPGYSTEKFLHAKAAGAIPIYWGSSEAHLDFNMEGAIDARNCRTAEDLQAAVKVVDTDDELWNKKASTPCLTPETVENVRKTMSDLAKRVWKLIGTDSEGIPPVLGAAPNTPEASFGMGKFLTIEKPVEKPLQKPAFIPEVPIVVTYVSWRFLGSLNHWLSAIKLQTQVLPTLTVQIFHADDVPAETIRNLKEKYSFATFEQVPAETPTDFPDFWDPTHYAWKLWLYHAMATRPEHKGRMCFYMDAGCVLCRWPMEWLRKAQELGICFLEDPRQENDVWCTPGFCKALNVTEEERQAKQIWAGSAYFRSGHEDAVRIFEEAYRLSKIRSILVGPRVSGVGSDGKVYGHRQDQSVLSILVRRFPVALLDLDTVYCDHSIRKTMKTGRSVYAHRGNFNTHLEVLPGIDDAFIINLERRSDRLEKFFANHSDLVDVVTRWNATDGRSLQITKELATLFRPNDFFWKKSVMGCALSHVGLWWKLVNEPAEIENYLIFEDDAKLVSGWRETLQESMAHLPDSYDVLYLGGILPPNRQGFEALLEPVTKYYSRVKPNTVFGQAEPTSYFHSCAYAYILSRKGASKIVETMRQRGGYWTSADHVMCGPNSDLDVYFLTPTVAGCYQDEDPAYASSQFNNFSRIDSFDSDLWNNDERFTKEEVQKVGLVEDISIGILLDAVTTVVPKPEKKRLEFLCLDSHPFDFAKLYERDWLQRLFGDVDFYVTPVNSESPVPKGCPIFILQRPHVEEGTKLLETWSKLGGKFKILHLSDEHRDSLVSYTLEGCVSVLRFYIREDFPDETVSKISVIPLGYKWRPDGEVPPIQKRTRHWSFFGTGWNNRVVDMKPLTDTKLVYQCKFFKEWNDPSALSREKYMKEMTQSIFIPCPKGVNAETFRFYEALESGCVPLVIKTRENEQWFKWVSDRIPLVVLENWGDAVRIMNSLLNNGERLEIYREKIRIGWKNWVRELEEGAQKWIRST